MERPRQPPRPSGTPASPAIVEVFPHQLRVGDVILTGDEELPVVGKPRRAVGTNHITVPVRALTGHADRSWGAHEKLRVRRTTR
jgi:hypothetical protein